MPSLILNTKKSDATEPSESSVLQSVEALDNYVEDNDNTIFMTSNMSNLLVAMFPSLCNSSTHSASPTSPTSHTANDETLKLRVESAERWHKNTARMLLNVQTEHDIAPQFPN